MAKQQGKATAKTKGAKQLRGKKQPLKDLEARKEVKAGALKRPSTGVVIPED